MKQSVFDIFMFLSVLLRFSKYGKCSLSCLRTFLREEDVSHLIFIDRKSDSHLAPLFESMDWFVTTMNITSGLANTCHEHNILIAPSIVDITKAYFETIHLPNKRTYIVLSKEELSINTIRSIFSKLSESMQTDVIVVKPIAKVGDVWQLFRFIDHCNARNDMKFVATIFQCNASENNENFTYLTNHARKRCSLTVAAAKFEPLTYYDESRGFYKGVDYYFVKIIAEYLRYDVNFVIADENSTGSVL